MINEASMRLKMILLKRVGSWDSRFRSPYFPNSRFTSLPPGEKPLGAEHRHDDQEGAEDQVAGVDEEAAAHRPKSFGAEEFGQAHDQNDPQGHPGEAPWKCQFVAARDMCLPSIGVANPCLGGF